MINKEFGLPFLTKIRIDCQHEGAKMGLFNHILKYVIGLNGPSAIELNPGEWYDHNGEKINENIEDYEKRIFDRLNGKVSEAKIQKFNSFKK